MDPYALERYEARFGAGARPDPNLKGVRDGNCNLTACQAPNATHYNVCTRAWYCAECAEAINRANCWDAVKLYGVKYIVASPEEVDDMGDREMWKANGIDFPEGT